MSYGECTVLLINGGAEDEHVVVERADDKVEASPDLVRAWLSGESRHVKLYADDSGRHIAEFGTKGEGVGVVRYEIGPFPVGEDLTVFGLTTPYIHPPTVILTRLKEDRDA